MKNQDFNRLFGMYDLVLFGSRVERFLNIATFHGIQIRHIKYDETGTEEGELVLSTLRKKQCCIRIRREDYDELKSLCEKYNVEILQQRELGIPGTIKYYRPRVAFYLGAFGCFLFLIAMSHCIWEIEIKGNSYYTNEELLSYLKQRNIIYGCNTSSFSCEKEELILRKKHDRIAWCSMSVEGCKLILTVTENKVFETDQEAKKGWSIVADKAATIRSIVTRTGTPMVKQNEEVKKGQVLVAGYLIYKDDYDTSTGVTKCVADADIYGVYDKTVSKSVSRTQTRSMIDATEDSVAWIYKDARVGKKMLLDKDKNESILTQYVQNPYVAKIFPDLYRLECRKITYREEEVTLSKEEATLQVENEMELFCKKIEEKGCKIIEKNLHLEHNKKEVVLSGTLTIEERFCSYKQTRLPEIGKE